MLNENAMGVQRYQLVGTNVDCGVWIGFILVNEGAGEPTPVVNCSINVVAMVISRCYRDTGE